MWNSAAAFELLLQSSIQAATRVPSKQPTETALLSALQRQECSYIIIHINLIVFLFIHKRDAELLQSPSSFFNLYFASPYAMPSVFLGTGSAEITALLKHCPESQHPTLGTASSMTAREKGLPFAPISLVEMWHGNRDAAKTRLIFKGY